MKKNAHVYVISSSVGNVKIGMSIDPEGRRDALQANTGVALRLVSQTKRLDHAQLVERTAHKLLASKRMFGEWFDVTPDEAIAAVQNAIDLVDSGAAVSHPRLQLNVRIDADLHQAIEEVRKLSSPIPTVTEVIRRAVLELRDRQRQKAGRARGLSAPSAPARGNASADGMSRRD